MMELVAKQIDNNIYFVESEFEKEFDSALINTPNCHIMWADIIVDTKTNTVVKSQYPMETIIAEWSRLKKVEWYLNTIIGNGVDHEQSK